MRNWNPENPRFPWHWQSTTGEAALRRWRKPQLMDSRLIFRPFRRSYPRDEGHNFLCLIGLASFALSCAARYGARRRNVWFLPGKQEGRAFREKLGKANERNPYRKPTLVDRASSPRGTSESSLRNSAKKRPYLRYKACLVEAERRKSCGVGQLSHRVPSPGTYPSRSSTPRTRSWLGVRGKHQPPLHVL